MVSNDHPAGVGDTSDLGPGQDFETLAGFILARLGHIPAPGEAVEWQGYRLEVVDMDGRRIDKVLAVPLAQAAPGA